MSQKGVIVDDIEVVKEINRTDSEWRQLLGESKYFVLREKGTERAFTGNYLNHKGVGIYVCGPFRYRSEAKSSLDKFIEQLKSRL